MKRLTLISLILGMVLTSCKEYGEVRIMPEFNNSGTEVELYKNEGSSKTVVISTTANEVTADYNASWLSVDANKQRIIYTALATNETGEVRSTTVKLILYGGDGKPVSERRVGSEDIKSRTINGRWPWNDILG